MSKWLDVGWKRLKSVMGLTVAMSSAAACSNQQATKPQPTAMSSDSPGPPRLAVDTHVVYPAHGVMKVAGMSTIDGASFYVLKKDDGATIRIPVGALDQVGIRAVIATDDVEAVYATLRDRSRPVEPDWDLRYRTFLEHIKTGSVHDVAMVVRDLRRLKKRSWGEERLLTTALWQLTSELAIASKTDAETAEKEVLSVLGADAPGKPSP